MSDFISPSVQASSSPEYNILLLGETGVGKSTTINAMTNYLNFVNFDEASAAENFQELIQSRFSLPNPDTGEPMIIESGNADPNERLVTGQSSTISPIGYPFKRGNSLIRLIDTPGIGDTQGIESDKENFEKILNYLHFHKAIHGIIILLKATDSRQTATIRYCLTELLTHLHKSACKNIVFCFTFSRSSLFGPGDGYTMIQNFLKEDLNQLDLKLQNGVNCFFIDNEGFRFLLAKKQKYHFTKLFSNNQEKSYEESWNTSVKQTERMFDYIINLEAHDLEKTISLNHARKLILDLAEPIVKLQCQINVTIKEIENKRNELLNLNKTKQELAEKLILEVDDLSMKPLDYPTTVCTAQKCIEVIAFQGQQKINYKTRCHENCQLTAVQTNLVGHSHLKECWAMNGTLKCRQENCGCPWEKHMHITCEYIKVKRTVIDLIGQRRIQSIEANDEEVKNFLYQMEITSSEYENELKVIQNVAAKFAYILTSNATMPYNKFTEPYLNLLINEEIMKIEVINGYSETTLDSLKKMKETNRKNIEILTNAIAIQQHENVRIEDIESYRSELLQLKHSGPQFRDILEIGDKYRNTVTLANIDRPVVYLSNTTNQKRSGFLSGIRRLWY